MRADPRRRSARYRLLRRVLSVVLLLALSVSLLQRSQGYDGGWQHWSWRFAGVAVGVLAVELVVREVQAARRRRAQPDRHHPSSSDA